MQSSQGLGSKHAPATPTLDLSLPVWRSWLWRLTPWLRWYVRSFPIPWGRGVVLRSLVTRLLPANGTFRVAMPSGHQVRIGYRERIGLSFAVYGDFEPYERRALMQRAAPGSTAIDVGANVGIYALELSTAVGEKGKVIAVEPWPDNVARLQETLAGNRIANVRLVPCAVGADTRTIEMYGGLDPAMVTAVPSDDHSSYSTVHSIPQRTLDDIWAEAGRPAVSIIKADVEGLELEVLKGARTLLAACKPALLCEANSPDKSRLLGDYLQQFGYRALQPAGFEPWNFLFLAGNGGVNR